MWALVEGLWYSFLILLEVIWRPALVLLIIVIILRIIAKIRSIIKKKKK